MKKIFNGKIILYLMLFSPLIDIITSVMLVNNINFTLGIFIKCIMLFLIGIYLLFIDKSNKKINYIIIALLAVFNVLNMVNNISVIKSDTFSFFGYLIKYDFNLLSLLFFVKYFRENRIDIKLLKVPIIIVSLSLVISLITNSAMYTYDAYRFGTSSWFSSANEFGALLSILYPIAIYLFLDRKDSKKIDVLYVIIIAYGLLELGTKVGLLSFIISSLAYLFFRLINMKSYKLNYSFYVVLLLLIIPACLFNNLPTVKNVRFRYDYVKNKVGDDRDKNKKITNEVVFSNRDQYFLFIKDNNYDTLDYLVGKTNLDGREIVIIEMDIFDIFFMFGIYGFVLLYGIIGYLGIKIMKKYFSNFKKGFKYIKINMLIVCLVLTFLISCIVGHVILCPSVSVFFGTIYAYLYAYDKFEKEENNKIQLLIGAIHMQVGGIERTLISLLKQLDYNKYDVDLFLQLENGEFYHEIPNQVKVITPYNHIFSAFFAKESKISKIIKHALFNKYSAWLWTNNKVYDVAIDYTGYYLFTDYYVAKTSSKKKYIWVHQNVDGSIKYNNNFKRSFIKNIKKYNYFDKIVCVSETAKTSFDKMFGNLKNKTTVINNLQDNNVSFKEKITLSNNYNIVSVGRLTNVKGFDRLIQVHKKLIDKGIKVNTYIIGNGEEYDMLASKINELKLEDSFTLLGQKSNVFDYLKAADLFVTTTHSEAFPTVLIETLLCNTPWVGPRVNGVVDIAKLSPQNSFLLTDDSVDGIVTGIENAIKGRVNKKFKFDIDKYNKNILKKIAELIGE